MTEFPKDKKFDYEWIERNAMGEALAKKRKLEPDDENDPQHRDIRLYRKLKKAVDKDGE